MKVEVPECKRCFCCIPLRYGLLFWSYVKLVVGCLVLGLMVFITIMTTYRIQRLTSETSEYKRPMSAFAGEIVMIVVVILALLLEISMNIVYIVGGHKKDLKLMKVYFYYNIVTLCVYILAFTVFTALDIAFEIGLIARYPSALYSSMYYIKFKFGAVVINIALQLYLIFLIRSELRKLQNHGNFRFHNNAVDAECNMEVQDGDVQTRSNENSDKIAEENVNDTQDDVIKNNNINRERDDKLKLNKYQLIKNVDTE